MLHREPIPMFSVHARKFSSCNELAFAPTPGNFIPPEEDVTNDNIEEFFVQCWEDGTKPNVTQGHRYINHILTHHGRPPLNKHYRKNYSPVLDVLKGLKRTEEWRDHKSKGAEPLPLEFVKKILLAKVHDEKGNIELRLLRNKALASALILCGWHPSVTGFYQGWIRIIRGGGVTSYSTKKIMFLEMFLTITNKISRWARPKKSQNN
jgi:hypothetical protein